MIRCCRKQIINNHIIGIIRAILSICLFFFISSCDYLDDIHKTDSDIAPFLLHENINYNRKVLVSKLDIDSKVFGNNYKAQQSLAVYGNYAFTFESGGRCLVFDLSNNEPISLMKLPVVSHSSNAQFLNVFYEYDDEFPLLLFTNDSGNVSVYRIQKIENTFICDLIKTITIQFDRDKVHGFIAFSDTGRNKLCCLYSFTPITNDVLNNSDAVVRLIEFDSPDYCDSTESVLNIKNSIFVNEYPFFVLQGVTYNSDKYVFAAQLRHSNWNRFYNIKSFGNVLLIADSISGELCHAIYTNSTEPEGVSYNDDIIYHSVIETRAKEDEACFELYRYKLL